MGERDWISRYFKPLAASPGAAALSDDVAALTMADHAMIITADTLIEGVHFLSSDPIESIARKLVRVNVSDILSKGAVPREALLSLGWPRGREEADLAAFAEAFGDELGLWGAQLIGGDTTTSPQGLYLSLTLTGGCGSRGPVRRSGGREGDSLWVTGEIGAACLGFRALQARRTGDPWIPAYRVPRLAPLAVADLVQDHATASMDVSDGLLGDVRTLAAASGLAAELDLGAVPFAGNAPEIEEKLELATWGDDYQVLFAAPPTSAALIASEAAETGIRVTRIGTLTAGSGLAVTLDGAPVNLPETLGFEHG